MPSLPYKFALITGASSGIGEALARKLSKLGVSLVLLARSKERLEQVAHELAHENCRAIAIPLDVTRPDAVEILQNALRVSNITIDLLINNAGFGSYGDFQEADLEKQIEMIDLNVTALVKFTGALLPHMGKPGAIVNISSASSFQPIPFMATYAATKSFVTSFSMALASELRDKNIHVLAVCPGRVKTNFQVVAQSHKIRIRAHAASAESIAELTIRALRKKKLFVLNGFFNNLRMQIQRYFPRRIVLSVTRMIFKPRHKL